MFSVPIANRNLSAEGSNCTIYVLVNCVSVKLQTSLGGEVLTNVPCVPMATETP